MKTHIHLWLHLAELFLEWEMFQTEVVGKIQNTHFMFNKSLFFKNLSCKDNVEMFVLARQDTDGNTIRRIPFAC